MAFSRPRGTQDLLPADMSVRNHVERAVRSCFEAHGFQQIQTPMFEEFALLSARSGEEIRESMFTFVCDQTEYALRPELTAAVCRLVASGQLEGLPTPHKLYYIGQCFRYGRPQAGRYREFTQAGLELLGSNSPLADAEVIAAATQVLRTLGIDAYVLKIGNIGIFRDLLGQHLDFDQQSRVIGHIDGIMSVREKCAAVEGKGTIDRDDVEYVKTELADLYRLQERINYGGEHEVYPSSDYSEQAVREWLGRLPLAAEDTYRALWTAEDLVSADLADTLVEVSRVRGALADVEEPATRLLQGTPAEAALADLREVCGWLVNHGVDRFDVVLGVARGLDFYTGTVFEIDSPVLGAQKQVCGGGRYDRLVGEFQGPETPATGFAFGFDRLVEVYEKTCDVPAPTHFDLFVATPDEALRPDAVRLAADLRREGVRVGLALDIMDLRDQLGYAAAAGAARCVILGTDEFAAGQCRLRDMVTREEAAVPLAELKQRVQGR